MIAIYTITNEATGRVVGAVATYQAASAMALGFCAQGVSATIAQRVFKSMIEAGEFLEAVAKQKGGAH